MWTQIVGKVRLALEPMVNHWWQVPLYVSARGLTTSLMHAEGRGLELEFDFLDHALHVRTSDGGKRRGRARAAHRSELLRGDHGRARRISTCTCRCSPVQSRWSRRSRSRKTSAARTTRMRCDASGSRSIQAHRVMTRFRARFLGKVSPVHFFWGAPDLAVTRFSGRPAPTHPRRRSQLRRLGAATRV